MKKLISSAGLLYLYLNGYEEDGIIYTQQVNTYTYLEDGFCQQLMTLAEAADKGEGFVHIFAVVGIAVKADNVYSIIESELKSNFQRILSGKPVHKASDNPALFGIVFSCSHKMAAWKGFCAAMG